MNVGNLDTQASGSSPHYSSEFERLLGDSIDKVRPGRIVTGRIVGYNKDVVTVDIGYKSEGVIPIAQFMDSDGNLAIAVGENIDVYVVAHENEFGQVILSKERANQLRVWKEVNDKYEKGDLVRGKVIQKVKGGLQVDIGIPAFLPGSQIDIRPHRNLDKFIAQIFDFKVLKITKENGNIVLSRRAVLENERDQLKTETLKVLSEGIIMEGFVKNITDYGAFIDLGGIDGLLHITDISWGRVTHPSEKLSVGQTVPVVVLKYDGESQRVSLGMKQLKEDPWQNVSFKYPVGSRVRGKVINLTEYGAFVELEEGVEGLVHVTDMSWTKKVKNPNKLVNEGDVADALVLGIDTENRKISLGMKQLTQNPWDELARKYPVGTKVKGKVRSVTEFGIFIGVEDGIDGLVHVSDFSWTKRIKDPKEIGTLYKKNEEVEAIVLEIDPSSERLSLGIKQLETDPWENVSQRFPIGAKVRGTITSVTDFGVFVEIEKGIEGLIHVSQLGVDKGVDPRQSFEVGLGIESEVTNIDREERRISLSVRAIKRRLEKEEMTQFMDEPGAAVTFGDLIRQKMGNLEGKKE